MPMTPSLYHEIEQAKKEAARLRAKRVARIAELDARVNAADQRVAELEAEAAAPAPPPVRVRSR